MTPEEENEVLVQQYRKNMRKAAVDWRNDHATEHNLWTLETVKHLAFVNAAGLAGAAALYSSTELAKKATGFFGIPTTVFFALGLVLAVLDMYLNSLGALRRIHEVDGRLSAWDKIGSPQQHDATVLLAPSAAGRWLFLGAAVAGWGSAILFVAGALPFALLRI